MLNSGLWLLVLLLTTSSSPDCSKPRQTAIACPPVEEGETLGLDAGPGIAPGSTPRHSLPPQPARYGGLLDFGSYHNHHAHRTWKAPALRLLKRSLLSWIWASVGNSSSSGSTLSLAATGSCSSSISGCLARSSRVSKDTPRAAGSSSSSKGWGIRIASAELVDAGGINVDGSGLRGARQAVSGTSSRNPSTASAGSSSNNGGGSRNSGGGGGATVCSDTCPLARNGICEDGSNISKLRREGGVQVACDFGTDCTDCGPYKGIISTWGTNAGFKGPIDFLRRQGVKVYARRVAFEPRFLFAYTDPKEDLDVSDQIERVGCMELGIVQIFHEVLSQRCAPFRPPAMAGTGAAPSGALAPLVVDVGANFGFFSVYAAMMGCRVVAVEPVPRFLAFLHWSLAANGLRAVSVPAGSDTAQVPFPIPGLHPSATGGGNGGGGGGASAVVVVERVVSTVSGENVTMTAPRRGVWGTASVAGTANNIDQDLETIAVESAGLDEIVGSEQVLLLKVDVEGYEPVVFRSGEQLLSDQRVEHIVLEYSPGMPETLDQVFPAMGGKAPVGTEDPPKMLLDILGKGYSVVHLPDNFAKSGFLPQLQDPLPEFQEVTARSVLYDIADLAWFRNFSGSGDSCPWPSELRAVNEGAWGGSRCLRAPEDSHPKGLRVALAYNTNLWAARNRSDIKISGTVGLFGPDQDETRSWSSQRYPETGVGNRACPYLPASMMVRSRCRCLKPDLCGREEEVLLKALAEGRLPRPPPPPSSS